MMNSQKGIHRPPVLEFVQHRTKSSVKMFSLSAILLFVSVVVTIFFLESMMMTTLAANGILQVLFLGSILSCTVAKEQILVMRSMGLQIQTTYLLGGEKTYFIPQRNIVDIIINEAISMHKVSYYLVVLLKTDGKPSHDMEAKPLFMKTMPPLKVLKEIRRGCQEVLLDDVR